MYNLKHGIPHGKIVSISSKVNEQLDMIRKMSQTSRNESIALYVCLEQPIGVDEAIRKYMENK
ncbi:hypothetical protein vBPpSSYP_46 [Pseudomonas phage vB_PpS_SYP]|nr:hypothetical protein vBPpSSYP_46 [Pseudomonas phage vB_PpS_SYP]